MRFKKLTVATLSAVALAAATAVQAAPALTSISGGTLVNSASDQLYGWAFNVNSAISVTALGVYDDGRDGMAVAHDIGIYRSSDQTLLASATLSAGVGGVLDGDFRYTTLGASVGLDVGAYVMVMTMPELNDDMQLIRVRSFTTAPQISWTSSAFGAGSSLAFPAFFGLFGNGMFGPNFQFDSANAVPLPSSLPLAVLGLALLLCVPRRLI